MRGGVLKFAGLMGNLYAEEPPRERGSIEILIWSTQNYPKSEPPRERGSIEMFGNTVSGFNPFEPPRERGSIEMMLALLRIGRRNRAPS